MNLKLCKTPKGTWKLTTTSNNKNPALMRLAELLRGANKSDGLHIGIYAVTGGFLEDRVGVYSYISQKSERMTKKQYRKWIKGERQIYTPKSQKWIAEDSDKSIEQAIEEILK